MDSGSTRPGRGGAREGAGRPPGSLSRLAKESREQAKATGMLPHEILLSMARGEVQIVRIVDEESGEVREVKQVCDLEGRRDAAKAAAPYYAPKLSAVETIGSLSDDELDEIIRSASAEAGLSLGADRESAANEADPEPVSPRERRRLPDAA